MDPEVRFDALYRAHYGAVLRYAARRADPETARDVVAETFLVAWRRLSAVPAEPTELALLSEEDQEALRLVGWEELDLAGAARAMGCSRGAMAVRLHRARRRLKRALQATSGDVMSYGRMS